ncbi:MAG: hypothetical protein U0V75_08515 [Ferruginibacter sp.]
MPKYGQDNQIFSFTPLSAPVPGWTIFSEQLCATSKFSYKFNFGSGRTVGKSPNFAKPWPLTASQPQAQSQHLIINFLLQHFYLTRRPIISICSNPSFWRFKLARSFWYFGQPLTNGFGQVWPDKLISANCIAGLQFWLDVQF